MSDGGVQAEAVVTDPAAVRLLADPSTRRFLEPFMGRAVETAEAARSIGVTTEVMAYRVGRLRRLGLVTMVGARRHAGRTVPTWTAPAAYRCPLDQLPDAEVSTAFSLVDEPGRRAFHDSVAYAAVRGGVLRWDLRVHRDDGGDVRVSISPTGSSWLPGDAGGAAAPAVVLSWVPLSLSPEQARHLQQRLLEAVAELPVDPSAPTHLCGLFLTPVP